MSGSTKGTSAGRGASPARLGFFASVRAWWRTPMGTLTYNGNGGAVGVGSVRDAGSAQPQRTRVAAR